MTVSALDLELEAREATRTSNQMLARLELYNITNNTEILVAGTGFTTDIKLNDGVCESQRQAAVTRTFQINISDPDGIYTPDEDHSMMDPLARPVLKIWRGIRYRSGLLKASQDALWPQGTFVIETNNVTEDENGIPSLDIEGSDRSVLVSANTFTEPYEIVGGPLYHEAIMAIIKDRCSIYAFIPKFNLENSTVICPDMTLAAGDDGWAECQKLAEADGKELYLDAHDTFVLRTIPHANELPVAWEFDSATNLGMLPGKSRNINVENAYNGVTCVGSAPWLLYDVRATAWDDDPTSLTYYLGPFGKKPYELEDAMVANYDQALVAAQKELLNRLGVMEDVSFDCLPVPFVYEGQVVNANSPNIRLTARAMIETRRLPLTPDGRMSATLRRQRIG